MAFISLILFIIDIINRVIVPVIFGIAFISFIWGVFNYFIANASDTEKRKEARNFVMYGIIGFFLMMSIWGIVNALVGTFGFNAATRPDLPSFNGGRGYGFGVGFFGNAPANTTLNQQGQVVKVPAQQCGSIAHMCMPWNECIGGFCQNRSGLGGPGEACQNGTCVNGYHCASNVCVQD